MIEIRKNYWGRKTTAQEEVNTVRQANWGFIGSLTFCILVWFCVVWSVVQHLSL